MMRGIHADLRDLMNAILSTPGLPPATKERARYLLRAAYVGIELDRHRSGQAQA